jgi:hypothetical protein
MKKYIIVAALVVIAACSGSGNAPPSPPVVQPPIVGDTLGMKCLPVTMNVDGAPISDVHYRVYCAHSRTSPPAFMAEIGLEPMVLWSTLQFPEDGVWYCGFTAYAPAASESGLSEPLGVRKEGSAFFRIN